MTPEVWQKLIKHVETTCSPESKKLLELTVALSHKVKPNTITKELPLVMSWFNLLVKVHHETGLICLLESLEHIDPQLKKRACSLYNQSLPFRPVFQRSVLFLLKELHESVGKLAKKIDTVLPDFDKACTNTAPTSSVYREMMTTLANWLSLVGNLPTLAESQKKKTCPPPTNCKSCTAKECCPRNVINLIPWFAGGTVVGMVAYSLALRN